LDPLIKSPWLCLDLSAVFFKGRAKTHKQHQKLTGNFQSVAAGPQVTFLDQLRRGRPWSREMKVDLRALRIEGVAPENRAITGYRDKFVKGQSGNPGGRPRVAAECTRRPRSKSLHDWRSRLRAKALEFRQSVNSSTVVSVDLSRPVRLTMLRTQGFHPTLRQRKFSKVFLRTSEKLA
jgi:hypothetical protein